MKEIAIYGAGGFGREIACLINIINQNKPTWKLIGFFDDNLTSKGKMIAHHGVCFGGIEELENWKKPLSIVIAIGNPKVIISVVSKINNPLIDFPNIIHPDFTIVDTQTFKIGKGNIIQGGCSVSCNVTFGNFNICNGSIAFGHDNYVGNYNVFMPAVRISGEVTIGNENSFGVGSIILQQITIGNNVRLGAGSVMIYKPKNGKLYIGNPAAVFDI